MTKSNDKKVPALRFKGFTDDWEQRKLGDLTKRVKSYPISHNDEMDSITGTKYIHYGDIHTRKFTRIENDGLLPNIIDHNYISLENGDVVVADASEDYKGIADACIVDRSKSNYKIIAGLHTIAFRPNNKLKANFLYNYFSTSIFKHYGYKMGTGLKVFGITYNNLANMIIKIPDIQEQTKINEILNTITKLLSLQQRKLEQLNLLKQAMSQQIFTNKKFPKIRFKNFTSIWKDYKFEDIFAEFSVKSKRENEYRILSSTNNGVEIRTGRVSGGSNIGYKIINDGDIVLSPQNLWLGNINLNDIGIGLVSPSYHTFKIININPLFIKPQLHSKQMLFKYKMASIQGASVVRRNLDMNAFSKITLKAPTNELEQGKIAIFCSYIEKIIGFQQKRINYLITLKKALLQNMFV